MVITVVTFSNVASLALCLMGVSSPLASSAADMEFTAERAVLLPTLLLLLLVLLVVVVVVTVRRPRDELRLPDNTQVFNIITMVVISIGIGIYYYVALPYQPEVDSRRGKYFK